MTGGIVAGLNHVMHKMEFFQDGKNQKQKKNLKTKEAMLKKKLSETKIGEKILGEDLKRVIPDMKGVDYIERTSETKFKIHPTLFGSVVISKDAYLEINLNAQIQGIGNITGKDISYKGISVKVYGVSESASIKVGKHRTQNFTIVGNQGMFKVGNKVVIFGI